MADEINVFFTVPGDPAANMARWRTDPPAFLVEGGYLEVDASYESLVFEADVTSVLDRVVTFGFGDTLYRLTFTFRLADGATQVFVLGQMNERTRGEFDEWVAEHGTA